MSLGQNWRVTPDVRPRTPDLKKGDFMRKFLVLLPLLVLPVSALAQETPQVEVFGGYSNLNANMNASSVNLERC